MSDCSIVNETVTLLRPLVEDTGWIDQTLDETDRHDLVGALQRSIAQARPGGEYYALKRHFAAEKVGSSVQASALREACFEIARSRAEEGSKVSV